MKQEMTLNACVTKTGFSITSLFATALRQPLSSLTNYYSRVLEQPLNNRQTLLLLNAQLAFLMAVFPVECPLLLRLGFLAWLGSALLKCREVMRDC